MRLMIVDNEGVAYEVTDELEAYDLSKPMAKDNLIQEIVETMARVPA